MKKRRWISLLVENEIGVLARVSGLFSGKSYNIDTLSVGTTEDETVSRMTISFTSDDKTFEQVKKQLNRSVEVIKVVDFSDAPIHLKELMFIRVTSCSGDDKAEIFRITEVFGVKVIDCSRNTILVESVQTEKRNNDLAGLLVKLFGGRVQIVRGGCVGIEALTITER